MGFRDGLKFFGTRHGIKVIAAVAAVAAWYAVGNVTGNEMPVADIQLTVLPPEGWTVTEQSADRVNVQFRGTRDDIRYLNRELIKATVDLRGRETTETVSVTLGARNVNAPGGARVLFVQPATLKVKMDRRETRQVPVELVTQNLLPDGYERGAATLTPASVEVTGPAQVVGNLASVPTVPLDLDGRVRPFNRRRLSLATGGALAGLQVTPGVVTLDMPVIEQAQERTFEHLPVRALAAAGVAHAADIEPETATVTLKGRPETIKKIAADDLQVFADTTTLVPSERRARRPLRVHLPAGVSLVDVEPASAQVRLAP